MKKCNSKLFKKVMSLVLVCTVCSQFSGTLGQAAATEKTAWSLYFNPSAPPAESVTRLNKWLTSNKTVSMFSVTSIASGVKIKVTVPDAKFDNGKNNKTFSGTDKNVPISVKRGHTYSYTLIYVSNINSVNRVKGNIVH